MAQYQASLGQVGMARQATLGTPATLSATAGPTRWMKLRSSSVGADRNLLIPDPEIGGAGARDVNRAYLGPVHFSGDHDYYIRNESLPLWIYAAMGGGGGTPTGTAAAGYVHTITPADTLQAFTIQEALGNTFDVMQYSDAFVNSLRFECNADGYMMGKANIQAITGVAGATATTSPAFDATPLILGSKITLAYNSVTIPAQSFNFEFNNNIEASHYTLGSLFVDAMTPKRRDLTGSFTLRPQSSALFRQAVMGTSGTQTSPTGLAVAQGLTITCTTYEIITGATTQVYTLALTLPEVYLAPHKVTANQDNIIEESIDFRAVKIAAANSVSAVVTNGVSTAYNV